MSLQLAAKHLASQGRGPDSMLIHMSPREVQSLQEIARAHGGSLSINPETGLVEAGFLKNLLPMIAGMGITALTGGAAAPWMIGLGVGGIQAARTGSLEKGLMAGLGAYGGAGLGSALSAAGSNAMTTEAAKAAASQTGLSEAGKAQAIDTASIVSGAKEAANPFSTMGAGLKSLGTEAGRNAALGSLGGGFNAARTTAMALAPVLTDEGGGEDAPKDDERYNYEFNPGRVANPNEGYTGAATGERTYFRPSYTRLPNSKGMAEGGAIPYDSSGVARFDNGGATNDQGLAAAAAAQGVQPFTGQVPFAQQATPSAPAGNIQPVANNPYYTMSGQSGDAYRYLMGLGPTSGTSPTVATPPPYTTPTIPTTGGGDGGGGGGGGGGAGGGGGGASVGNDPVPEPPYQGDPYDQPYVPPQGDPYDQPYVPPQGDPNFYEPYVPPQGDPYDQPYTPEPAREPVDKSYWDNPGQEQVGPSRGLRANQEELPEEFDKYLKKDDDELGYLTGNRPEPTPEPTPEPAQDMDPNFFEPGYGNTGTPEPTEYEVQPWENVNNPDTNPVSSSPEGLPDAFGSYPGEPTYIDDGGGAGSGGGGSAIEIDGDVGSGDEDYYDYQDMADGGLMAAHRYAMGGSTLGGYSDGGRLLRGPGDGVSDSIPASIGRHRQPARLADGEFVVPARSVSELGNGSTEAGARKLYAMMDRIQAGRKRSIGKGNVAKNTRADKYLPA